MTTHGFEADLRAILVGQRPTDGARVGLRHRVDLIPERIQAGRPLTGVAARIGVPIAAIGLAAAAVLIAALGFPRAPIVGLPPGGGGVPVGFDPSIEGPGILAGGVPSALVLGLVVALLGAATALGTFLTPRAGTWRGRAIILLGVLLVGAGVWLVRFDVGLVSGGLGGGPLGYVYAPRGPLDHGDDVLIVTAAPGQPHVGLFSLRNDSAVPIRVEGILPAFRGSDPVGRWTALWIPATGPGFGAPALDSLIPFEPISLEPGEGLTIYIAGIAGQCAFGPGFDPNRQYTDAELGGYTVVGPEITVAYSAFGLSSTRQIDMLNSFATPMRASCPSSTGAGD